MKTVNLLHPLAKQVLLLLLISPVSYADENSNYQYRLLRSSNNDLCKHMLGVYNKNFRRPWDTPYPPTNESYGEDSLYAFPKLTGVKNDPQLTFEMRFFRQPTSPEFEAIEWREGRVGGSNSPILWADFDIDNDGKLETVAATPLFSKWQVGNNMGQNGFDYLNVFAKDSVGIKSYLSENEWIGMMHNPPTTYPLPRFLNYTFGMGTRPFAYKSMVYISAYNQKWKSSKPKSETITIYKYLSGGEMNAVTHEKNYVSSETMCEFLMMPIRKQQ